MLNIISRLGLNLQGVSSLMSLDRADGQPLVWRKARRSMSNGECVEVAYAHGRIFIRDSKNPGAGMLACGAGAWRSFLTTAEQGRLDLSTSLYQRPSNIAPIA